MYFLAEHNGNLELQLSCNGITGKLAIYKDIPYSKLFGFIGDNIFETIKDINNINCRDTRSLFDILKEFPIQYWFGYKDNGVINQGVSSDVSYFNTKEGNGYGNKPTSIVRKFNKQVVIIFKFIHNPPFIESFKDIWKSLRVSEMKGSCQLIKKHFSENLENLKFNFDNKKPYYNLILKKSENNRLSTQKMFYLYDHSGKKNHILVDVVDKKSIFGIDREDMLNSIKFEETNKFIGGK